MHKNCFWHVSTQLRLTKNCDTVESRYINEGHGDLQNMFLVWPYRGFSSYKTISAATNKGQIIVLRHFKKMAPFLHSGHTYPLPLCIPTPPPESMLYLDLHVFLLLKTNNIEWEMGGFSLRRLNRTK